MMLHMRAPDIKSCGRTFLSASRIPSYVIVQGTGLTEQVVDANLKGVNVDLA
jgi:hypothetical protein